MKHIVVKLQKEKELIERNIIEMSNRKKNLEDDLIEEGKRMNAVTQALDTLLPLAIENGIHIESIEVHSEKKRTGRPAVHDDKIVEVLRGSKKGMTASQIADETGISRTYVYAVMKRLHGKKVVRKRKKKYYV